MAAQWWLLSIALGSIASVAFGLASALSARTANAQITVVARVDPALLEDLVAANRILAHQGLFDAYGHVSVRQPANAQPYLLARSLAPVLVTAQDIREYDLESNSMSRDGSTHLLERFIHGETYKARPDVTAVIHTHCLNHSVQRYANPAAPVFHMAAFLHVGVPVWDPRGSGIPDAAAMLGTEFRRS